LFTSPSFHRHSTKEHRSETAESLFATRGRRIDVSQGQKCRNEKKNDGANSRKPLATVSRRNVRTRIIAISIALTTGRDRN